MYTNNATIKFLFEKESKPRLMRWIFLFKEFDMQMKDKKGPENKVADQLSRLLKEVIQDEANVTKEFPN